MKQFLRISSGRILLVVLSVCLFRPPVTSQPYSDSLYVPPLKINAINGYGPFVIGSERSNLFIIYEFPPNSSKVIMKMVDSKGVQISSSHTESGSNLQTASWNFESDTMNFPLSPQLSIVVYYQNDSVATYLIPYTVYPDTITLNASAGFGPFITNDYAYSDTLWSPVPQKLNRFTVKNLPPRSDTINLQILTVDSAIVFSATVTASPGTWLDSAVYNNIRMDQLPLDTRYVRALIHCQGGPEGGLSCQKELAIIPQKPRLTCVEDNLILHDSIGPFTQNQTNGQALFVDSISYAQILNGPGHYGTDNASKPIYTGPYSIDVINGSFTLEAWLKFNLAGLNSTLKEMTFMKVDTVWQLYLEANSNGVYFAFNSLADSADLWSVSVDSSRFAGQAWHHLAFTCNNPGSGYPTGKFYLDGVSLPNVNFNQSDYDYIQQWIDYRKYMGTLPLILGGSSADFSSLITAMDEVRIWSDAQTDEQILNNYMKSPLQTGDLQGYWNFDDLRNRLNYITDKSINNCFGTLKNHAYFVPQYPGVQRTVDTIKIASSSMQTDSVQYLFIDRDNDTVSRYTEIPTAGKSALGLDVASLPYTISHLKIVEYYHPSTGTGLETDYDLLSLAPQPISTPQYNWSAHYSVPSSTGKTFDPVTVSAFPPNTQKVFMGLTDGNMLYDTVTIDSNSIPYHHSLQLNGADNYIQTTQQITSPTSFTIMFWVKSTSASGGRIIGFSDSQNGTYADYHDRDVVMEPDGSLRFIMLNGASPQTLYAENANNDGNWHHVAVTVKNGQDASIYVDGSLSQTMSITGTDAYQGWWVIGRTDPVKNKGPKAVAEYFDGSVAELSIWNRALDRTEIDSLMYRSSPDPGRVLYYPFSDASGTGVADHAGSNNGTIEGSAPLWLSAGQLSDVVWNYNITAFPPGTYTLFMNAFYPYGPVNGANYSLGNIIIEDPAPPGETLHFNLSEGQGYFDEGISLINILSFSTSFTGTGQPDWSKNYVRYFFFSPGHILLGSDSVFYTSAPFSGQFDIDMGDAPVGSYISLEIGYLSNSGVDFTENSISIPIYTYPLIPPRVKGNFGPFDQAIAPGVMHHSNTFSLHMEPMTDLDSIAALFYDGAGNLLGRASGVKISDTLWTMTFDMSVLSPPLTNMNLAYYLGQDTHPAAIEGPYPISIHKTRPTWFDFLADTSFHNVQQSGNVVTFSILTCLSKNWMANHFTGVEVPSWIPLIGGIKGSLDSPDAQAYLQYDVTTHEISLTQAPEFYQDYFGLGAGIPNVMRFSFNTSQNDSYSVDNHNNLIATQNFKIGGGISTDALEIADIAKRVANMINYSGAVDPSSIIVQPSFKITVKTSFEYASRLHLMIDTTSGNWGSFGNLKIDADSTHGEAYRNSASYQFYSGSAGMEFSIGAKLLEGLVAGYFGLDGRVIVGYGNSYISIPADQTRPLKSGAFQIYGRFYISALYGWYEKNLWGPKLFYSDNFWGDNLSPCFPPMSKKSTGNENILANSSDPLLADEIVPVSGFTKMPQLAPYQSNGSSDENRAITWVEKKNTYGERGIKLAYLLTDKKKFSDNMDIESNNHAINFPAVDAISNSQVLLSWAQTRYDNQSILSVDSLSVVKEFLKAQDIWFAVYDISRNEVIQKNRVDDDTLTMTSGRAEANPSIVTLSPTRALIVWQVADLDDHTSGLWYITIDKQGSTWQASVPKVITGIPGVKTQVSVGVPESGKAIVAWLNTSGYDYGDTKLMASEFDGSSWTAAHEILPFQGKQVCNYFTMKFHDGRGALAMTTYTEKPEGDSYEKLTVLPWDPGSGEWNMAGLSDLASEGIDHLQLPRIAINNEGHATIALKLERIGEKSVGERISRIDLFSGDLKNPSGSWSRIKASPFVCDTSKQVDELIISYIAHDTLMILTNEYPMLATISNFQPVNGMMFGDPYMNLVLRCFAIRDDSLVNDVPENDFFTGIHTPPVVPDHPVMAIYPNPCRGSATARFDLADRSCVNLELYDLRGAHIATLIDQILPPGSYEMKLNTSGLRQGLYTCVMTCNGRSCTVKLEVLK